MRVTLCCLFALCLSSVFLTSCATDSDPELVDDNTNPTMNAGPIGTSDYIYRAPTYQVNHLRN